MSTNFATSVVIDSGAMIARELRRTVRSVDGLVSALILPVIILLIFTQIFGGAIESGGEYINYVVPGVLILCAGFGSASTAVSVAMDMKSGTIDRFKTMPIYGSSVLVGHVVASVIRNLVASTLVVLVALALGFRPDAGVTGWLAAIGVLILFAIAITWVSCAIGLAFSPEAANTATMVMLFLPYLSSGFVMTSTMPDWLGAFSRHQPLTPTIEALRGSLMGTGAGNDGFLAVAWCAGIGFAGYVIAGILFRRRTAT
jgi:ABC-2 type transport system permease protein